MNPNSFRSAAGLPPAEITNMWMQTYTGRMFYPTTPDPMAVHPEDIAHALALTCRYGGHVDSFYSVAEHCVLLHDYLLPHGVSVARHALLHDAAEAYVGDLIRPVKVELDRFKQIESDVLGAIYAQFGLARPRPAVTELIVNADLRITLNERDALMARALKPWAFEHLGPLVGVTVHGWSPSYAESQYLKRMDERGLL